MKSTLAKINKLKDKLAKDRDELRDLIYDLETTADGFDEAIQALEYAADAMSQTL